METQIRRFESERWTAGVIGLGYVGLPLAVQAAQRGIAVVGYDISEEVISGLQGGVSHVDDVDSDELKNALAAGFSPTSDSSDLAEADAIFICVPSPLTIHRAPDLRYIEAAAATVAEVAHPGLMISLESTSYPGTTEEIILPPLAANGLVLDEDVFVAFSPERVDPGNPLPGRAIPKVVGGVSRDSGHVAAAAYGRLFEKVHMVTSAKAAEMTKLLENTFRAVNIGLINEMAELAHKLHIDIWEVIAAAATKPFGFQAYYPGPGVGGHCIPLDPHFLSWRAREAGFHTRFIELAEQVNGRMPSYTAARLADLLNARGLPVSGTPILAVGVAYKPNISDDRESPAYEVLDELTERGAEIYVWDPHVDPRRIKERGFRWIDEDDLQIDSFEAAVILTDHDAFPYAALAEQSKIVFDARGAYHKRNIQSESVVTL